MKRFVLASAVTLSMLSWQLHSAYALQVSERAPNFKLNVQNLKDLQALKGKVVLVDFWAHWCKPCKKELPVLQSLYAKYKGKGLVIVGINVDKEDSKMRKFLDELTQKSGKISFPIIRDTDQSIVGRYGPDTMPSSFLVDKKGKIAAVFSGYRAGDEQKIENKIKEALAAK